VYGETGIDTSVDAVAPRRNFSMPFGRIVVLIEHYRLDLVRRGSAPPPPLGNQKPPNKNLLSRFSQILSKLQR
jgi:hypothetical protein